MYPPPKLALRNSVALRTAWRGVHALFELVVAAVKMLQPDPHGNKTFVEQHGGEIPGWFAKDDTCGPSLEAAKDDEAQLQEAVLEEGVAVPKKKPKKSRYELERFASKISKMGADGKEDFYTHLGRRIRDAGQPYT